MNFKISFPCNGIGHYWSDTEPELEGDWTFQVQESICMGLAVSSVKATKGSFLLCQLQLNIL